jgi:hypothetical protein
MIGWFGGNKDEKPLPKELGPLNVAIGGAFEIDFLSLEADALGGEPAMPLPRSGPFIIAGYGEVSLDAATVLSRYYDEENRMIQVMSSTISASISRGTASCRPVRANGAAGPVRPA